MEFNERKHYYNRCNPDEALTPDDARNLDVDSLGSADELIRGTNWVEEIATRIELSDKPVCELFTGLPGSGKSTELLRLARRLADPKRAHLLPIIINAESVIDLASPVDIPELVVALLYKTDEAILEHRGRAGMPMGESLLQRFWHWLSETDLSIPKAEVTVGTTSGPINAGAKLVVDLKTDPSLRERVRTKVSQHLTTFIAEVRHEIKHVLTPQAQALGYSGIIIIFDSLEKLRGLSTNWNDVLSSAERVFTGGAPYLKMPVHVVYTIPPALVLRMIAPVHFMPMLKLQDRSGNSFAPGLRAAREIIRRRVPDDVLSQHFAGLNLEAELDKLVQWSGGYPREIIRLLQRVIQQSSISEGVLDRLRSEAGDAYRRIIPATAFPWLAKVALDRSLVVESDDHRETADFMLSNNTVLRYRNNSEWFDVHPAVLEHPAFQDALAALQRQRQEARKMDTGDATAGRA